MNPFDSYMLNKVRRLKDLRHKGNANCQRGSGILSACRKTAACAIFWGACKK